MLTHNAVEYALSSIDDLFAFDAQISAEDDSLGLTVNPYNYDDLLLVLGTDENGDVTDSVLFYDAARDANLFYNAATDTLIQPDIDGL